MQANTIGDTFSWSLVETDGATPFPLTGVSIAKVAIAGPYTTNALAVAASSTAGTLYPATYIASPPTVSWVTTISGQNSATQTTYPSGGYYAHQIVITYANGNLAKSRTFVLQISGSIA